MRGIVTRRAGPRGLQTRVGGRAYSRSRRDAKTCPVFADTFRLVQELSEDRHDLVVAELLQTKANVCGETLFYETSEGKEVSPRRDMEQFGIGTDAADEIVVTPTGVAGKLQT
jgi:hypothetical protein